MKIPKKLKIGGYIYEVIYPYIFKERTDRFGFTDVVHKKIYLREKDDGGEKFSESYLFEMLLHEILHAIDNTYNAGTEIDEEKIIRINKGLYQVLKDNNLLK